MPVLAVTSLGEFETLINNKEGKGVFVDFFAEWCGPCKMVSPKIDELSNKYENIIFVKIDVDQASELAQKFQVRAMPTFLAFHKGEKVGECVGADMGKIGQLIEKINSAPVPA